MGSCDSNIRPQINIDKNNGENLQKQNPNQNEYVFPGIGTHITDDKVEIISNQKEKSICKILINKESKGAGFGTGFLCYIRQFTNKIKALITAYHVLGEEDLKFGKEIKITFNDNKKIKIIKIAGPRRIYASKKDDITIIEIIDSDKLKNYDALEIDENIYNNIYYDSFDFYNEYNNTTIYILHYPEGNIINFNKNVISDIDKNNNIYHFCATEGGSSGAPILNLNTLKVIGIHQGYGLFEKEKFHNETKMKYQNGFNEENKFLCNVGKIMKEPIINFLKNKITLTLVVNNDDIGKKNYFLQNYEKMKKNYHDIKYGEYRQHKLNINNFVILINNKMYESKEYFIPQTNGKYHITIFLKNNILDCFGLFYDCWKITNIDLSSLNTKDVSNMSHMFSGCYYLYNINFSSFDTKNVTYMSHMFSGCFNLVNLDLSSFDTKSVIDMSYMFYYCQRLQNIDLSFLDTKNVNNMSHMFSNCECLFNINLSSFDTKNVTDMSFLFYNCNRLKKIDLFSIDTKNVNNMENMFSHCDNLEDLDLTSFNTKSVENYHNMAYMFNCCVKLKNNPNFHYNKNDDKIIYQLKGSNIIK